MSLQPRGIRETKGPITCREIAVLIPWNPLDLHQIEGSNEKHFKIVKFGR